MILNAPVAREMGRDYLIFLHGLLGSGRNWAGIASRFSEEYKILAPDARNHGGSGHQTSMNYPLMAQDVAETLEHLAALSGGSPSAHLVGHSMGGKTAMELALSRPDLVRTLTVVDISPKDYPPQYQDAVESLAELDLSRITSRSQAMDALAARVPDRTLRGFFLTNLRRLDAHRFQWGINIEGIRGNFAHIWEGLAPGRRFDGPVLVIRGEDSGYVTAEDEVLFRELFPRVVFKTIPDAGHWVHVDQPEELFFTVSSFIEGETP